LTISIVIVKRLIFESGENSSGLLAWHLVSEFDLCDDEAEALGLILR
jgi:hypothetical protein